MYSAYGKSHNGTVLIKAYLLACFPLSAQLFVCLIVCNFRSDNKRGSRERSTGLQTNKKSIYILLYDIRYCFLSRHFYKGCD